MLTRILLLLLLASPVAADCLSEPIAINMTFDLCDDDRARIRMNGDPSPLWRFRIVDGVAETMARPEFAPLEWADLGPLARGFLLAIDNPGALEIGSCGGTWDVDPQGSCELAAVSDCGFASCAWDASVSEMSFAYICTWSCYEDFIFPGGECWDPVFSRWGSLTCYKDTGAWDWPDGSGGGPGISQLATNCECEGISCAPGAGTLCNEWE